ncbi:odorant receptor 22c-like isoform X2 [Pseudomyrmex gracilis]|uniref:odorant receptor 22c-like isoform X2 n=1 Tax=Pseudomyrmex gracilis TaxID=219809 RepID=UPI0009959739|nr:odorant receptor 22c-like isoform X2 [Pseudomyrmex gracilis]
MKTAWNHYYYVVRKISSFTGMWPYLKPRTRIFRVVLLTMIVLTIFVPQIAYQYACKNLDCAFESMTSYLLSSIATLKVYTFQLNIRAMKNFTRHLLNDWTKLKTSEECEIVRSYAENSRRFSLIYSLYCFSAVFLFMSMSLIPFVLDIVLPLNGSRPLLPPYPGYYFVDIRDYFTLIFSHSVVAWEVLMAGIVAHDCMFVCYVEHICSMFAIVGFRFEHLFPDKNNEVEIASCESNDKCQKRVAFLIHTHREALQSAKLLENIFTVPFAVQILMVTLGMSVTLLQIAKQNSDVLESTRYLLYTIGQLIHLFFLSFEGQKLIDHSLQMRDRM